MSLLAPMENFRSCLTKLKYPEIEIFTDEDIIQLLMPMNRTKLLSWLLKQIFGEILLPSEPDDQIRYIADMVSDTGFCSSSEKMDFAKASMDMPSQFIIFKRMFNWILINADETPTDKPVPRVSPDTICQLVDSIRKDAPATATKCSDHVEYLQDLKDEIKDLESQQQLRRRQIPIIIENECIEEETEPLIESLPQLIECYKKSCDDIRDTLSLFESSDSPILKVPDNAIDECVEHLSSIVENLQDLKILATHTNKIGSDINMDIDTSRLKELRDISRTFK